MLVLLIGVVGLSSHVYGVTGVVLHHVVYSHWQGLGPGQ